MDELAPQTYCERAELELAALIRHQRRPRNRVRQDSALLRRCVERVLAAGSLPERPQEGPWRVVNRPLRRRGRGGLRFIPEVQRGETVIMVSTPQEADELAAFLNFCGMEEFSSR